METRSQAKLKLKRQCDDNESGDKQRKSQRLASSAEVELTTKIIDLNDDCLVKIFGHLDLQNLFNVAVANEYLRPAARDVYERKFGTKMVEIRGCENRWNAGSISKGYGDAILISGLKTSLQFLRCFGSSASNLSIDYDHSICKRYEYVHQYMSVYCDVSLAHIEFQWMPIFKADPFQKAFVNVKGIEVWFTTVEQQLQSFPNLTRLNLRNIQCGRSFVADPFQHLEHLSVDFAGSQEYIQNEFVADLLRGAQQLKCMAIRISDKQVLSIETLLDMVKDKPLLAELKYKLLFGCHPMPVNMAAAQRIISEHPAMVELDLPQFQFSFDSFIALIDQLKSLNKIRAVMLRDDYHRLEPQLENKWYSSDYVYYKYNDHHLVSFTRKEQ